MQPNGYFYATYSAGSVSENDSSVDKSQLAAKRLLIL